MNTNTKVYFFVAIMAFLIGLTVGYSFKFWEYGRLAMDEKYRLMQEAKLEDNETAGGTTTEAIANLASKTGVEFDRGILAQMIKNHEEAIALARLVRTNSKRTELIKLSDEIIATQTREINTMRNWRNLWFMASTGGATVAPQKPFMPSKPTACTLEARICADGTYVGRTGPNCEFAPCPGN